MIEPTDEMVQEIYSRIDFVNHGNDGIREGLAAVFAVVERDYDVRCGAAEPNGFTCDCQPGHDGRHGFASGGELMTWT